MRSATRPWVDAFADLMEEKLDENRDKGDRDGWRGESAAWLLNELENEVRELRVALHLPCQHCSRRTPIAGARRAIREKRARSECADVANFAMMIADVAGGMKAKRDG